MVIDTPANQAPDCPLPDARGAPIFLAPCASVTEIPDLISKLATVLAWGPAGALRVPLAMFLETGVHGGACSHGGPRLNSGGARPGAGRPKCETPVEIIADLWRWYCIRTDHNAERRADIEVRLAGFEVFNPSVWRAAEPARRGRGGSIRAAKLERIEPMFRRYFFTRFRILDPSWGQLEHLPGVDHLMGAPGGRGLPGIVSDESIALIRLLLEPNNCMYPFTGYSGYHHRNAIEVGSAQRLLTGALEGQEGICTWSDGRRARLLLSILGREVSVTVKQSAVEAA